MDFEALLSVANNNQEEAKYEGCKKRYSTIIAPPKKLPKSNVQTQQIKRFLARKDQEQREKAVDARRKKEQLLAIRAQNAKNNKKAKIMASRTKDNDFSKIKLTEDDVEANRKRERELQALALKDKLERMKARIELVEKEKQLPHKRKRKNKPPSDPDNESHHTDIQNDKDDVLSYKSDKVHSKGQNNIRKRPPPPNSSLNFYDLLKVAAEKQYEPIELPKLEKVDDRPLSKKAKRLLQEEENRVRRKMAAAAAAANNTSLPRTDADIRKAEPNIQNNGKLLGNHSFNRKANSSNEQRKAKPAKNHPTVVQLRKVETPSSKHKAMPSKTPNNLNSNFKQNSPRPSNTNSLANQLQASTNYSQEKRNVPLTNNFKKDKSNSQKMNQTSISQSSQQKSGLETKIKSSSKPSKSKTKTPDQSANISNNPPSFLTEDVIAQITNQIREKLQKELEEKFVKQSLVKAENTASQNQKAKKPISNRSDVNSVKKSIENYTKSESAKVFKQPQSMPLEKSIPSTSMKKVSLAPKKTAPTKTFHPNPYLLPPRRLLESHRPIKPVKRRFELDDDEDDDDDDDMKDFIDDSSTNQDDYSKYIKDIFNYDRSSYADVDDDDIEESSFAQVCQEEVRSAKIGYLEDLEEEKKEKEEMKRLIMKKKKK